MRISFVWDWEPLYIHAVGWQDGLAAAINELQKRGHELQVITCDTSPNIIKHNFFDIIVSDNVKRDVGVFKPDVILMWGDFTRPNAKPLSKLKIPMAICFAGGDVNRENAGLFQHVFVESDIYWAKMRANGLPVSIAFGANTDLFVPITQPKVFDTIFPGNFSTWKRHPLYAEATKGLTSLTVGHMRPGIEEDSWQVCQDNGIMVLSHVSSEAMKYLYAASRICVITSNSSGGSQRTVLEAMAMNIPVVVSDSDKFDFAGERIYHCDPNPKDLRSYINTLLDGEPDVNTRDYIVANWSEKTYADSLEEELLKLV